MIEDIKKMKRETLETIAKNLKEGKINKKQARHLQRETYQRERKEIRKLTEYNL